MNKTKKDLLSSQLVYHHYHNNGVLTLLFSSSLKGIERLTNVLHYEPILFIKQNVHETNIENITEDDDSVPGKERFEYREEKRG